MMVDISGIKKRVKRGNTTLRIDEEVKRRFKKFCTDRDLVMGDMIEKLLIEFLEQHDKKGKVGK